MLDAHQAVYLRELYDQPKVALSLKTRTLKAEAIETLLYGCSMWTFRQDRGSWVHMAAGISTRNRATMEKSSLLVEV